MELGGIEFCVSFGVPRQHYQQVVATLPRSRLRHMEAVAKGAPLSDDDGNTEEEPGGAATAADVDIDMMGVSGGGAGASSTAVSAPTPKLAFVVTGPLVHTLSVSPDLESLLIRADSDARAARGPTLGSSIPASQPFVEQFLAMPLLPSVGGGKKK